ncbi:MAG TPA: Gfo/Idh/MocA family oxidoreductase [Ktedonobacteraceae bacterium]
MQTKKDGNQMQSQIIAPSNPVRWGVLSVANIAIKRVIPALVASESEQLVAVASRNLQRAREHFSQQPAVRLYNDYQSLIDDPEIEAIYNPLPNSLHARWTIKALLAGKHVLCEKPLAVTAEEGALMIEAARSSGKLLMEAFMYRFHPQIIWSLEQIRSGRLGEVRMVRASFFFNILLPLRANDIRLQPQLAGGSLMDVGCYPVNFCRAVYGRPPTAVAARVYAAEPGAVEHTTSAVLDFSNGRFGEVSSSFGLPTQQSAEVIGEHGSLSIPLPFVTGAQETEVILSLEGQTIHQKIQHADPYRLEIEHFGACVRTGAQPAFSLDETLENLATVEAIYQSASHPWPPQSTAPLSYSRESDTQAMAQDN